MKYTDLCARLTTWEGDSATLDEAAAAIRELEACNAILTNLAIEAERIATYERKRAEAAEARGAELTAERDAVEALVKAAGDLTAALDAFWQADEAAAYAERNGHTEDLVVVTRTQTAEMRDAATALWQSIPALAAGTRAALRALGGAE
jgi:hypothetical protein